MAFRQDERVALFIDAYNTDKALELLGWQLDFIKLRQYFAAQCDLLSAHYYTTKEPENDRSRNFLHMMRHNGFEVVVRPFHKSARKGVAHIALTVGMARAIWATESIVEHIALMSGDGCYTYAVEQAQLAGLKVTVLSTHDHVSSDLRAQADFFLDLATLRTELKRPDRATV